MTLRLRLILTIGGVALLMVLPALYAAHRLSTLREIANSVSQTHGLAFAAVSALQNDVGEISRLHRSYVAVPDESTANTRRDSVLVSARVHVGELRSAGYGEEATQASSILDRIESEIRYMDGLIASDEKQAASDRVNSHMDSIIAS